MVWAFEGDIRDAKQCLNAIRYYEGKYNIPQNLLRSIALVESGRWHEPTKSYVPWPWSANLGGESFFFANKNEAVRFIKAQIAKGKKNIDVGCNQINLYHHGENFYNIEQALNPELNARYAAQFLHSHYENKKNWLVAVGNYHSLTPHLGKGYAAKVIAAWKKGAGVLNNIIPAAPSVKEQLIKINQAQSTTLQNKLNRSKQGIIVFSRNQQSISPKQKEEKALVEVSSSMLQKY